MNKLRLILISVICLLGCKKERLDEKKDNRFITENKALSTTRIVNLSMYNQVVANGDTLTKYILRLGDEAQRYIPTLYFPKDGILGTIWQVPQDLFRANGIAQMDFNDGITRLKLPVTEKYGRPTDYYLLTDSLAGQPRIEGQPAYVAVERGVGQPSKPDHFKIRILNLSARSKVQIDGDQLESLEGPVSLAYADGSLVAPQTTNVTAAQRLSDYIELPYGSYQFRVLTPDGRQLPGSAPVNTNNKIIYPSNSTISTRTTNSFESAMLTFAPVASYQPGGVYTIVIAPYNFSYYDGIYEKKGALQNGFRVITDVNPGVNNTYYRLQGVNALPGSSNLGFRINGKALASGISYGQSSDYGRLIQGMASIEAVDASGKVLATLTGQVLRPGQNYSAWLYPDQQGGAKLTLVANDLSGFDAGTPSPDGGAQNGLANDFMFNKRFLNLSPDNPYITFTFDNGQLDFNQKATVNLQPGLPITEMPYIISARPGYNKTFQIMAYRSSPAVVPGSWAEDIVVLKNTAFVADELLYMSAGRDVPIQEPGIYTVALIGRTGNGVTEANKAKLIIVKHNR
ncbi:DUF4397 domain-containing protein [Pedobacter nutrimenti]|jgi:hypothetical protein|uniref:DUF4397 domain-containing protein n=1 Tax=Pedobacter nutrimenti TaxID=1241337 RepID=A0A318UCX1_9SPHI|nr:DUF4397 domain-containing protein [Pedobacter nutrimenti]PYF71649.1 hypothetical protein B0O44_107266 [Pedobacter nutrimenti]